MDLAQALGAAACQFLPWNYALKYPLPKPTKHTLWMAHSLGAIRLLEIMAGDPAAWKGQRVVLFGATPRLLADPQTGFPGASASSLRAMMRGLKGDVGDLAEDFAIKAFSPNVVDPEMFDIVPAEELEIGLRYLQETDLRDVLADQPLDDLQVLLFHGGMDRIVPVDAAHRLQLDLYVVENAGHMLPVTHVDTVTPLIRQWL